MKKNRFLSTLVLMFILGFFACKTEKDTFLLEENIGQDYFPLEVGKYITYEVDSTVYNPTSFDRIRHSKTIRREEIVDTLLDNEGNTLYKIERFERVHDSLPWQIAKVYSASISTTQAIRNEDNYPLLALAFPVSENKSWNPTLFFDASQNVIVAGETLEMFKGWSSRILELGVADTIGMMPFEDVLTLQLVDTENFIELRQAHEKYVRGIGLVYREYWILDTQCEFCCNGDFDICEIIPWEERAEKGFIVQQRVIDFN